MGCPVPSVAPYGQLPTAVVQGQVRPPGLPSLQSPPPSLATGKYTLPITPRSSAFVPVQTRAGNPPSRVCTTLALTGQKHGPVLTSLRSYAPPNKIAVRSGSVAQFSAFAPAREVHPSRLRLHHTAHPGEEGVMVCHSFRSLFGAQTALK